MLSGRYAGKKAVIVKHYDEGNKKERKFPHALVAGVAKPPMSIKKRMGKKRVAKRSKIRPFVKYVNYNHLLPTR
jgi:large subunit ribosomal protein L27e